MFNRNIIKLIPIIIAILILFSSCTKKNVVSFYFVCSDTNDLYLMANNNGIKTFRFDTPDEVIEMADTGSAVLILADKYPYETVTITNELFLKAESKNLKLYIEYPSNLPDLNIGEVTNTRWERGVVSSSSFGSNLPEMSIVLINDCHFVKTVASNPSIVVAKVAGFDKAVYGLDSTETHPILFRHPNSEILVSTTKLSQFITGRYAPKHAWKQIWNYIFNWLDSSKDYDNFEWKESVHPSLDADLEITNERFLSSINHGVDWFYNSKLIANKEWINKIYKDGKYDSNVPLSLPDNLRAGDGSDGIHECFGAIINFDGTQPIFWNRRADCASEASMSLAMRSYLVGNETDKLTASNLQDFIYKHSKMNKGVRANPSDPNFGFISWGDQTSSLGIYYGDDNARVILGTMVASAALDNDKWDESILKAILANFRSCNINGYKPNRLKKDNLSELGWQHYSRDSNFVNYAPHYQSWIWATFLWLYDKTGYEPLLERSKNGITKMMNSYPNQWNWTNGLQQERARMILPLSWLIRVDDNKKHRDWLNDVVNDLISFQDKSGAIREELGDVGFGRYAPPVSNEAYGTREAPLIQENGDPLADMLYTSNFAIFSLTEAAAVTNDIRIKESVKKLAEFLIRIQVSSVSHNELDGAWFRAFDFNRWEYFASNADLGWGAWSTETGWTQGWITTMLMMNKLESNLWDFTSKSQISKYFPTYQKIMLSNF